MTRKKRIAITGDGLVVEDVVEVARGRAGVAILPTILRRIQDNWDAVSEMLDRGDVIYGLNAGVGALNNVMISRKEAGEFSTKMLRAHASGYGDPVSEEIARATLLLRMNVFAKGYSGIRPVLFRTFADMLNKNVIPLFYEKGSVGTSGDLAALSQMGLVVIGEGKAYYKGGVLPGSVAMKAAGIKTVPLAHREGLAIMNGSQFMTAIAALNIYDAERLVKQLEVVCGMTAEILNGSTSPYSRLYNGAKPFKGQNATAANLRKLLRGSQLIAQSKGRIQDAYSLRCVPQVAGSVRDALEYARKITEAEMNAVSDNPLFFTKEKVCLTGANFHGAPIGYTQDFLGIVLADLCNISERQTNNMMDPACSGDLPAFLTRDGGFDSGLMIVHYTQAALVSENKLLASPASVDSIPVSANQEDHVSFGTIAARKCAEILRNCEAILAIQLLAVCQAYEFRKPLKPSRTFQAVYQQVREVSPAITEDRAFYKDIESVVPLIRNHAILKTAEKVVGPLK